jgi:NAD(P)-dependent dehydrogenase (short-subunit alcohol dehydrogenase family)
MIDESDWDNVLDTNLKSVWLGTKLYTERVLARGQAGGNIVNIASITRSARSRASSRTRCRRPPSSRRPR